jgi:hypothetical protein
MKLEGIRVQPDQIDLHLTIQFNELSESLPSGRIAFGIKGGQLKLKLENGKISYGLRELTSSLELSPQEARQELEGSNTQSGVEASVAEIQSGAKASVGTEQTEDTTEPFKLATCQVTTKGSQKNPAWVFEVETGEPVLKGSLKNAKLATLKAIAFPCYIEATFEVSLRDIYLTETKGLWPQNINRNQLAVLKRGIAQLLLKRKFQPYLSRQELRYER